MLNLNFDSTAQQIEKLMIILKIIEINLIFYFLKKKTIC